MWLLRTQKYLIKTACFLCAGVFVAATLLPLCAGESAIGTVVSIPLSYPQKSNAPKQQVQKTGKTPVISGKVQICVSGISAAQAKSDTPYVEYFLDDQPVYDSRNKKLLCFVLDTAAYPDGEHALTANLWDKNGPSAIGIKKIIVLNQIQHEN